MTQYFITGTDTGIGKTLVSAILTVALKGKYWKPIQSGVPTEQEQIKQWTYLTDEQLFSSIYSLKASLSPDQAAKLENIDIDIHACIKPETTSHLIVEGAGGVFVPLNQQHTLLDLMQKLQLPIIITARGALGTINHTMLTIEALRKRNLKIHGIVFVGDLNKENQIAIEKWGNVKTLFHVPKFATLDRDHLTRWIDINKTAITENF